MTAYRLRASGLAARFLVWVLAAAASAASAEGAPLITLPQALEQASAHNRQIENARLEEQIGADLQSVARSYRYPQLSFIGSGGYLLSHMDFRFREGVFGLYPLIGPVPFQDTTLQSPSRSMFVGAMQITQPISQQYKIALQVGQADVGRKLDAEKLRIERRVVLLEVKKAYFGVVQAQSMKEAADRALAFAQELARVTQSAAGQKAVLRADAMRTESEAAKARAQEQKAEDAIATAKEQLNFLLGRDLDEDFAVQMPPASPLEVDLARARTQALGSRPEIQEARLAVRYAELGHRVKQADYIPDISLSLSRGWISNSDILPSQVTTAGVIAQWNLFDSGRRHRESSASAKSLRQAQNAEKDAEAQVMIEVGAKARALGQARLAYRAAELDDAAEQERLREAADAFRHEFALRKDLLEQQARAAASDGACQKALQDLLIARAEFENAIGED